MIVRLTPGAGHRRTRVGRRRAATSRRSRQPRGPLMEWNRHMSTLGNSSKQRGDTSRPQGCCANCSRVPDAPGSSTSQAGCGGWLDCPTRPFVRDLLRPRRASDRTTSGRTPCFKPLRATRRVARRRAVKSPDRYRTTRHRPEETTGRSPDGRATHNSYMRGGGL